MLRRDPAKPLERSARARLLQVAAANLRARRDGRLQNVVGSWARL